MKDKKIKYFPEKCIFCEKYFPKNDISNIMKGGGDCIIWNSLKGGDCRKNNCPDFIPKKEKTFASGLFYRIYVIIENNKSISCIFSENNSQNGILYESGESICEAIEKMNRRLISISERMKKCRIKFEEKISSLPNIINSCPFSKYENDYLSNPMSFHRRRFNTFLKAYPKNTQITFRFNYHYSSADHIFTIPVRISGIGDNIEITMMTPEKNDFISIESFCKAAPFSKFFITNIMDEFRGYYEFIEKMKDSMNDSMKKWL